jgi:hypothetical protein
MRIVDGTRDTVRRGANVPLGNNVRITVGVVGVVGMGTTTAAIAAVVGAAAAVAIGDLAAAAREDANTKEKRGQIKLTPAKRGWIPPIARSIYITSNTYN